MEGPYRHGRGSKAAFAGNLLDEALREGARKMLLTALECEVSDYIAVMLVVCGKL